MRHRPRVPNKYALLIGIDSYPNLPQKYQLRGCVEDTKAIGDLLVRDFGFADHCMRCLQNEQATRGKILQALTDLAAQAKPGDVAVIFFSGHGSRVRHAAQPSGWTESIVPSDSGRGDRANRDILDLEIRSILAGFERGGIRVTLILDACFSGGATRHKGEAKSRGVEKDDRPRTALAAPDTPAEAPAGSLSQTESRTPYVMIAACGEEEVCWEQPTAENSAHQGCLTFHLCRVFRSVSSRATYREAFPRLARAVTEARPRQHPRLEGVRDRLIFGHHEQTLKCSPPRARILSREGSRIELDVGAVHGLPPGPVGFPWYVDAPDPSGFQHGWVGTLQVGRIDHFSSQGEVVEELWEGAVQPGLRAVQKIDRRRHYQRLLDARNDNPKSRLWGTLSVELWRHRTGQHWKLVADHDPPPRFSPGDRISLTIKHRAHSTLFIYLLDFGLLGRIAQIFPEPGGARRLLPGRELNVGRDELWPIELSLPHPETRPPNATLLESEHFKVVASTREIDFAGVEQQSFLDTQPVARNRQPGRPRQATTGDWTSVTRAFRLRRL